MGKPLKARKVHDDDDYDDDIDDGYDDPGGNSALRILVIIALVGGLAVVGLVGAAIVLPNLIDARSAGNESAAIGALRSLTTSQAIYIERSETGRYGTLQQLGEANLIDSILASGEKQGYRFTVTVSPTNPEYEWSATAVPLSSGSGRRCFYTDQSGYIRYTADGSPATASSPVLGS